MYYLVRTPQQNPVEQIKRTFNAMFATVRPGVTPCIIDLYTSLDFREAASSLSSGGWDVSLLRGFLDIHEHARVGPTGHAFVAQVKSVASSAEMTPYINTKSFVHEGMSHASFLLGVGHEIKKCMDVKDKLLKKYGPARLPYLKALRLEGLELLAPVCFLNLCKVANTKGKLTQLSD